MNNLNILEAQNLITDYLKSKNSGYKEETTGVIRNNEIRVAFTIFQITNKRGELVRMLAATITRSNKLIGRDLIWNNPLDGLYTFPDLEMVQDCSDFDTFKGELDFILNEESHSLIEAECLRMELQYFIKECVYEDIN